MASLPQPSRMLMSACLVVIIIGQAFNAQLIEQFFYLGVASNQIILVLGIPLLVAWRGKAKLRELFPLSVPPRPFWIWTVILALCFGTMLEYLIWLSETLLPLPETVAARLDKLLTVSSTEDLFFKIIFLCILPAIAEESCFRGFFQGGFTKHHGPRVALFITALIFALLHGNPWYLHIYFLLGLWFGVLRLFSASLLPSILCHFLNNSWTLALHAAQLEAPFFHEQPILDVTLFAGALVGATVALRKLWLFSKDFPRMS